MTGEELRFIQQEIRKQVNIILSGQAGQNDQFSEDIQNLYPGTPTLSGRPVMHPYGLVSRAPAGTIQVTARQGENPGNRLILGHRDANRPTVAQGETQLYNQFGQSIYLKEGEIHIGKPASSDPVPLGTELIAFLQSFIAAYKTHTHVGNLAVPTPLTASDAEAAQELDDNNLANKKIVSDYIFVEKSL